MEDRYRTCLEIPDLRLGNSEHDDITIENSPGTNSLLETKILVSQVQQIQLNPSATWFVPLRQQEIQHQYSLKHLPTFEGHKV